MCWAGVRVWWGGPLVELAGIGCALPRVGGLDDANLEAIVALRPDLVLALPSSRLAARLRSMRVPVAEFEAQTLEDVPRVMKAVATLLGQPEQADGVWLRIQSELKQAQQAVPVGAQGVRVYVEVATTPMRLASLFGAVCGRFWVGVMVPPELGPFPRSIPNMWSGRSRPDRVACTMRPVCLRPGWAGLRAARGAGAVWLGLTMTCWLDRASSGQAAAVLA